MARDDEKRLNECCIPEDGTGHKVALNYVFNAETGEFYPESRDLFSAEPQLHRNNVTTIDTEDPNEGLDCRGFKRCRFDIDVTGSKIRSLIVTILRWNNVAEKWFSGTSTELINIDGFSASGGKISLIENEVFGATIFLKISAFGGDSFALNAYNILC